jgi:hypothetical protein
VLKRDITYEDFNGNTVTETFYFNLTRTEIIELELSYEGGLEAAINRIISAENIKALITEFKKIVLMAYGVRSEDGRRFIKSDELREEFSQTAAYDKLFMELSVDEDAAAIFVRGIIPSDLAKDIPNTQDIPLPKAPPLPPPAN